jgi:hypothetical protein
MHTQQLLDATALHLPTILLPQADTDMSSWAVIACDQYTSQPDYWEQVRAQTNAKASTFDLILPEAFLEKVDRLQAARTIGEAMRLYMDKKLLKTLPPAFIAVERTTARGAVRRGLIVALDLEHYDFRPESTSLIRATEGTVMDRLPPRVQIREQALLELPHTMVLIDDPLSTVIEPLFEQQLPTLYDFDLMMNSGHIRGLLVEQDSQHRAIAQALANLITPQAYTERYALQSATPLLYAMGDGNHSLAAAKILWEQIKAASADKAAIMDHPARFSLVELVNIHDAGLDFEPIHRFVENIDGATLLAEAQHFFEHQGCSATFKPAVNLPAVQSETLHRVNAILDGTAGVFEIHHPRFTLAAAVMQEFLDSLALRQPQIKIDYVHGDEVVSSLCAQPRSAGFFLPAIDKHSFFKSIIVDGVFPRKTFSMGSADEKRFYLECRKILP